jgi:hypothetical protein
VSYFTFVNWSRASGSFIFNLYQTLPELQIIQKGLLGDMEEIERKDIISMDVIPRSVQGKRK